VLRQQVQRGAQRVSGKPAERQGQVLFINADREFFEGRAQNHLLPEHIEKIDSPKPWRPGSGSRRMGTRGRRDPSPPPCIKKALKAVIDDLANATGASADKERTALKAQDKAIKAIETRIKEAKARHKTKRAELTEKLELKRSGGEAFKAEQRALIAQIGQRMATLDGDKLADLKQAAALAADREALQARIARTEALLAAIGGQLTDEEARTLILNKIDDLARAELSRYLNAEKRALIASRGEPVGQVRGVEPAGGGGAWRDVEDAGWDVGGIGVLVMGDTGNWSTSTVEECCDILDNKRIPVNSEVRERRKGIVPYYGANGLQGYIDDFIFDEPLILIAEDGGTFDEFATRAIAYRIEGKSWGKQSRACTPCKESVLPRCSLLRSRAQRYSVFYCRRNAFKAESTSVAFYHAAAAEPPRRTIQNRGSAVHGGSGDCADRGADRQAATHQDRHDAGPAHPRHRRARPTPLRSHPRLQGLPPRPHPGGVGL
jgi:hypothetical protein